MIRLFDLGSLFRVRALNLFRDGALTVPGSVSARDQESVLSLLQQRGAPTPLERVEVDARDGLLQPAQTLLDRVVWEGRAGEVLLVLRDVAEASLREALLADERVRAFRCVVLVVPSPGGGESLGAWGELLLAVRDAVRDAYAARCLGLGLNPAALDPWQDVIASLQNPCDTVALVNAVVDLQLEAVDLQRTVVVDSQLEARGPRRPDVVDFQLEEGNPRLTNVIVAHRVVMRELAWRAADEVMVLLAIASAREALITRALGEGVLEVTKERLVAQQLWHPEDGLLGWASLLLDARCWEGALGTPGGLPTTTQRAEGWGAAHDDLGRMLGYVTLDRPGPDASSLVRDAHRALLHLHDGEWATAKEVARGLAGRFPREDGSADAGWRFWALRAQLASVEGRSRVADECWGEAILLAETAGLRAETLSYLLVRASYPAAGTDVGRAVALAQRAVEVLKAIPAPNRHRASAQMRACECLLAADRPGEALTCARRSLEERLAAGAPRIAVLLSRIVLARALLTANEVAEARDVITLAEAQVMGLRTAGGLLPELLDARAVLEQHDNDLVRFVATRRAWIRATRAIGKLTEHHARHLRAQARAVSASAPEAARALEALAAEVDAELLAAAARLAPRP